MGHSVRCCVIEAESPDACSLWIGNALYSDQDGRQLGSSGSVS